MATWSRTWTWYEQDWHEGNVPILGPRSHAFWLGSSVFDGARAFEGVTPDLERHCARVNDSARTLHLDPQVGVEEMVGLAREAVAKFTPGAELYIRPMYWPEEGAYGMSLPPDAASTRFCLTVYEAPMPKPTGFSVTRSPYRRPSLECMPVNAKAGCLYPNNGRALLEARSRGFDNCLMPDMLGNIAELASANVFLAKDGIVTTPVPNGTFLNGITRQRLIALLRAADIEVREISLTYADFQAADEIFSAGNFGKVLPIVRIDERDLQPGPLFRKARALYWDFAHASPIAS
jgi:branched-chain amino acid aminotransferase